MTLSLLLGREHDIRKNELVRRCKLCRNKLSSYNTTDKCFSHIASAKKDAFKIMDKRIAKRRELVKGINELFRRKRNMRMRESLKTV